MSLVEVHIVKGKAKVQLPDTHFEYDMRYLGINPEENDTDESGCSNKIRMAHNIIERAQSDVHQLSKNELTRLYYHLFVLITGWRTEKGMCGHEIFHRFKKKLDFAREHNFYNPAKNKGVTEPQYVALNMIMAQIAEDFIENHE